MLVLSLACKARVCHLLEVFITRHWTSEIRLNFRMTLHQINSSCHVDQWNLDRSKKPSSSMDILDCSFIDYVKNRYEMGRGQWRDKLTLSAYKAWDITWKLPQFEKLSKLIQQQECAVCYHILDLFLQCCLEKPQQQVFLSLIGCIVIQCEDDRIHELCGFVLRHLKNQLGQVGWVSLQQQEKLLSVHVHRGQCC